MPIARTMITLTHRPARSIRNGGNCCGTSRFAEPDNEQEGVLV